MSAMCKSGRWGLSRWHPSPFAAIDEAKPKRAWCRARSREMLMIVEVGVVVNSGPLSSPRGRGPDFNLVLPPYPVPEVGADNFYSDLRR